MQFTNGCKRSTAFTICTNGTNGQTDLALSQLVSLLMRRRLPKVIVWTTFFYHLYQWLIIRLLLLPFVPMVPMDKLIQPPLSWFHY